MKNLILTFVLVISSLVSYTQYSLNFEVNQNITTYNYTGSPTGITTLYDTIYVDEIVDPIINITVDSDNTVLSMFRADTVPSVNSSSIVYSTVSGNSASIDITTLITTLNDTIYFKLTNNGSYGGVFYYIVLIEGQAPTASIDDIELTTTRLTAYPNPATSNIKIDFDVTSSDVPVAIYNLGGQMIYSNTDYRSFGTNTLDVDVSGFLSGIYIVKAGSQTFKFVKQ